MKKNKTALVAGCAGFLGSHLVERLLLDGWNVRAIDLPHAPFEQNLRAVADSPKLAIEQADIMDLPMESKIFNEVDEIFQCMMAGNHLASKITPEPLFYPNLLPTIRVLEAARSNLGTRVHLTSSSAVYGKLVGEALESDPTQPNDAYGLAKAFQEQSMTFWYNMYNVPSITYRLFACYGPRVTSGGVFSIFLKKIQDGEPLTLTGDGSSARDFIYINDVVDMFIRACATDTLRATYNVGTGKLTTIKKVATLLGGAIEYIEARAVDEPIFANIDLAERDLGWLPTTPIEEGIGEIAKLFRSKDRLGNV